MTSQTSEKISPELLSTLTLLTALVDPLNRLLALREAQGEESPLGQVIAKLTSIDASLTRVTDRLIMTATLQEELLQEQKRAMEKITTATAAWQKHNPAEMITLLTKMLELLRERG